MNTVISILSSQIFKYKRKLDSFIGDDIIYLQSCSDFICICRIVTSEKIIVLDKSLDKSLDRSQGKIRDSDYQCDICTVNDDSQSNICTLHDKCNKIITNIKNNSPITNTRMQLLNEVTDQHVYDIKKINLYSHNNCYKITTCNNWFIRHYNIHLIRYGFSNKISFHEFIATFNLVKSENDIDIDNVYCSHCQRDNLNAYYANTRHFYNDKYDNYCEYCAKRLIRFKDGLILKHWLLLNYIVSDIANLFIIAILGIYELFIK